MSQPNGQPTTSLPKARTTRLVQSGLILLAGAFLLWPRPGPPTDETIDGWIDQAGLTRHRIAFGHRPPAALAEHDQASAQLRFWRDRAEPVLIKRLSARDGNWAAVYGKIRALAPFPVAKRLPILRQAISVRQSTVLAIGSMGSLSPRLEVALIGCSRDPDLMVRLSAVLVLGFKGSPSQATISAFENLMRDPIIAERLPSFMAGQPIYPSPSSTPAEWISDLDRPYHLARYTAVNELGKGDGDPNVIVPALIHALDDQNEMISNAAARLLSRHGPAASKALPALRIKLGASARITREIAKEPIALIDVEARLVEPAQ